LRTNAIIIKIVATVAFISEEALASRNCY